MKRFFDPDNVLWQTVSSFYDLVMLSLCWILCCLPVLTIIPSTIALYDSVARCVRGGDGGMFRRFFRTFRNELGRGILLTIEWGILIAVMVVGYLIVVQGESGLLWILYLCALAIPAAVLCWIIVLESRFVYSLGTLHRNAMIFTFGYLPRTAAMLAILVAGAAVLLWMPVLIVAVPGLVANFQSAFAEKVLKHYMPEEE